MIAPPPKAKSRTRSPAVAALHGPQETINLQRTLGGLHLQQGDLPKAEECFETVARETQSPPDRIMLAEITAAYEEEIVRAIELLSKVLEERFDIHALQVLGELLRATGRVRSSNEVLQVINLFRPSERPVPSRLVALRRQSKPVEPVDEAARRILCPPSRDPFVQLLWQALRDPVESPGSDLSAARFSWTGPTDAISECQLSTNWS